MCIVISTSTITTIYTFNNEIKQNYIAKRATWRIKETETQNPQAKLVYLMYIYQDNTGNITFGQEAFIDIV